MAIYLFVFVFTGIMAFFVDRSCENTPVILNKFNNNYINRSQLFSGTFLAGIFATIFSLSACRIAIGHDYWEYTEIFSLISQKRHVSTEWGFNALVKVCQFICGKENYIIIFAIVAFFTCLLFLRAIYEQSDYFAVSFILFMAFGYYLASFNNIRYYLALSIAVCAVKYIFNKDYLRFILIILIAALFHKAILFVLLAYPIGMIKWKKWVIAPVSVIIASLLFLPGMYRKLIFLFYPYYENSMYDDGQTSYINIVRCVGILVFALFFYKKVLKDNRKNMFYFNMNLEALIVYSCCSFIPVISRIGYMLNIFQIFLIAACVKSVEKKWLKVLLTVLIIIAACAYYYMFLRECKDDATRIVPYLNWILN